jgi:hypothetical protein
MARFFLGNEPSIGGYRRVFEIEGALEIDENNFTQIERTRVYFDDVLGMTYHKELGPGFLIGTGLGSLILVFGLILAASDSDLLPVGITFVVLGAPFTIAFLLRLILKLDVITVYGRRTKATLKYGFRKGFARELYTTLAAKIRHRQERALAAQPKPAAPPPPELPPGPPPS